MQGRELFNGYYDHHFYGADLPVIYSVLEWHFQRAPVNGVDEGHRPG